MKLERNRLVPVFEHLRLWPGFQDCFRARECLVFPLPTVRVASDVCLQQIASNHAQEECKWDAAHSVNVHMGETGGLDEAVWFPTYLADTCIHTYFDKSYHRFLLFIRLKCSSQTVKEKNYLWRLNISWVSAFGHVRKMEKSGFVKIHI